MQSDANLLPNFLLTGKKQGILQKWHCGSKFDAQFAAELVEGSTLS
jgi:hypothetical protein